MSKFANQTGIAIQATCASSDGGNLTSALGVAANKTMSAASCCAGGAYPMSPTGQAYGYAPAAPPTASVVAAGNQQTMQAVSMQATAQAAQPIPSDMSELEAMFGSLSAMHPNGVAVAQRTVNAVPLPKGVRMASIQSQPITSRAACSTTLCLPNYVRIVHPSGSYGGCVMCTSSTQPMNAAICNNNMMSVQATRATQPARMPFLNWFFGGYMFK